MHSRFEKDKETIRAIYEAGVKAKQAKYRAELEDKERAIQAAWESLVSASLQITINYDRSLQDMIEAGNYGWVSSNLGPWSFRINGIGTIHSRVLLVEREQVLSDAIRKLKPARVEHLLALGELHPDLQLKFTIMTTGSCKSTSSALLYPYLGKGGTTRDLGVSERKELEKYDNKLRFLFILE